MNEVRSKRGLSYGASARMGQGRGRKSLVVHVFPSLEQTCETLELVLRLWREWIEAGVTAREVEVLKLLGEAKSNAEIADQLFISEHTVKVHVSRILEKLGLSTRSEALRIAIRSGLVEA
jgi:DNA-binding CsgD family transcriptional regulator